MNVSQLVLLGVSALLIGLALFLLLRPQRSRAESDLPAEYELFGAGVRDDERYWLLGGFLYSNPDDPALFVINRWGIGICPNLAHRLAVRVTIGIAVVLGLIPIVLMIFFPGLRAAGQGCHSLSGCHLSP